MKIIYKQILCVVIAVISLTGCNKKPAINNKQTLYFQFEYVNSARDHQHTGFLIENDGRVMTYRNPQGWNFPDKYYSLTESQVRDNMGNCLFSGITISQTELNKYVSYIKNISLSKVTAIKKVAADAGTTDYLCYMFIPDSNIYKGYIIKKEGNITCENLNFYSKKVSGWLKSINDSLTVK